MSDVILETSRLLFRPHEPQDLDLYCAMEMDPEVRRFVGGYPRTREAAEERFRRALQSVSDRLGLWATVLKSEGRSIGRCGLYPYFVANSAASGVAVLAFYLAHAYWGRGLATEAGEAFIAFGFEQLRLSRIVATVEVGNDASVSVMQKLGFRLVETEIGARSFYYFELSRLA